MPEQRQASPDQRKTALITGATSGIGYELAREFAQGGYDVVLVARSQERLLYAAGQLKEAHAISVTALSEDLAQPDAATRIAQQLRTRGVRVDVLVNNAGFGAYGRFDRIGLATEQDMARVNMAALTDLTRLLLPDMIARGAGKILNVASTAAFQPGPLMAVYYASKAYVLSLSEALANELRGTGVTVTALCPGPTDTSFQRRANMERSRLFSAHLMSAETVARAGYRGLMAGRTLVIPGVRNRLLAFLVRWLPRDVVIRCVRMFQETKRREK